MGACLSKGDKKEKKPQVVAEGSEEDAKEAENASDMICELSSRTIASPCTVTGGSGFPAFSFFFFSLATRTIFKNFENLPCLPAAWLRLLETLSWELRVTSACPAQRAFFFFSPLLVKN